MKNNTALNALLFYTTSTQQASDQVSIPWQKVHNKFWLLPMTKRCLSVYRSLRQLNKAEKNEKKFIHISRSACVCAVLVAVVARYNNHSPFAKEMKFRTNVRSNGALVMANSLIK